MNMYVAAIINSASIPRVETRIETERGGKREAKIEITASRFVSIVKILAANFKDYIICKINSRLCESFEN